MNKGGNMALYSGKACRNCGYIHGYLCPQVKSPECAEDGVLMTRAEFTAPSDRPRIPADHCKGIQFGSSK